MKVERVHISLGLWLLWTLVNTAGFAFGGFAFHFPFGFSSGPPQSFAPENAVVGFAVGAVTGVVIGTLQWLVLRRVISGVGWWVVATLGGVAVVHAVGDAATGFVAFWVVALPSGVVIGILQWLVLRRLGYTARFWVLASIIGWFVGLTLGMALAEFTGLMTLTGPAGYATQHAVVGSVTGAVIGAITGRVLIWLVRQSRSARKELEPTPQSSTS